MNQEYHFKYKGVEYDASDWAQKHPGGLSFLQNMKEVKKDFTQYFRALHSNEAERILTSFKVIDRDEPTKESQEYMEIYKKVQPYMRPQWTFEILLFLLLLFTWLVGCTNSNPVISTLAFAFTQVVVGWVGHSAAHNRYKNLILFGRAEAALLGGFSLEWWSPKHNMHHMFTNIQKYDEDIQHSYKVYLYEFLYLKWRFDSFVATLRSMNMIELPCILTNYACLYVFKENFIYFIIGQLIAGFYSAIILIGNHEREIRFKENPKMAFIDHQIKASRNYKHESLFWLVLMGGMQYQSEHHLFPQIPFYRLPAAIKKIHPELQKLNKTLIYGQIY